MFTRLSNFSYGNYQIANLAATEMNVDTQLLIQIQKYESECLQLLLGSSLYDEFMSQLELDGFYWKLKSDVDEKWGLLLNGTTYECENNISTSKKWNGLIKKVAVIQEKEVFESLMAPYIFFYYSLNTRTLNTGAGEAKLKTDNTTQESSKNKRVDAWNEFVQWSYYGNSKTNVSLCDFLSDHTAEFGEICFPELNTMTYYDI
jgi:hypothetical protein